MAPHSAGTVACLVLLALPALPAASLAAAAGCTADAFTIDGRRVSADVCAVVAPARAGKPEETVVTVRLATEGGRTVATLPIDDFRRATVRTIGDVPLADVGIAKTLHVSVVVRGGDAAIEHALLVPGAVVLK